MCSLNGRLLPWCPIEDDFQSLVVGVGHSFTAAARPSPLVALAPFRL